MTRAAPAKALSTPPLTQLDTIRHSSSLTPGGIKATARGTPAGPTIRRCRRLLLADFLPGEIGGHLFPSCREAGTPGCLGLDVVPGQTVRASRRPTTRSAAGWFNHG